MTNAVRAREELEGLIRGWLQAITPEEREAEGLKLAGFLAARLAFWVDRQHVALCVYSLADQVVALTPPEERAL